MVTNTQVRKAVKELIHQYENGTHSGGFKDCPLCLLFGAMWNVPYKMSCVNCPNWVFYDNTRLHGASPCTHRTRTFPALNWTDDLHEDDMLKFWKQVLTILPKGHDVKFVLTKEISKIILNLAIQIQLEYDKEDTTSND